MQSFTALRVHPSAAGVERRLETCQLADLPPGDVLIKVNYSSLNYKDALSANGHQGITRHYPHTPGIDAAGSVVSDSRGLLVEGDPVVVLGFDLGMNCWGGWSEYIRVPGAWVVRLPDGLSLADAMRLGTAGVSAAYAVEKLLQAGLHGASSRVLVTGATGGVGSIAVHLLASLGYQVTASTGKLDQADWLKSLGAVQVVDRELLAKASSKALLPAQYEAAIDTVGQETLVNLAKSLTFGGSVAVCGLVGGTGLPLDIYPFILRSINLLGIASAEAPLQARQRVLAKYAGLWRLPQLANLGEEISLDEVGARVDRMLAGQTRGRTLVRVG